MSQLAYNPGQSFIDVVVRVPVEADTLEDFSKFLDCNFRIVQAIGKMHYVLINDGVAEDKAFKIEFKEFSKEAVAAEYDNLKKVVKNLLDDANRTISNSAST